MYSRAYSLNNYLAFFKNKCYNVFINKVLNLICLKQSQRAETKVPAFFALIIKIKEPCGRKEVPYGTIKR